MKKLSLFVLLSVFCAFSINAQKLKKDFIVNNRYILLPVGKDAVIVKIKYNTPDFETDFNIKLAIDKIDYWYFIDAKNYIGKTVSLSAEDNMFNRNVFEMITLSEKIRSSVPVYEEKLRPQLHFSSIRGWNNDPNGLVYYDGEYHLFYQHNPYDWNWGNMTWGHAVSKDLVHWDQLPEVLYPDKLGTMFSGSAVVDVNNTSGFQKGNEKTIVVFYTADSGELGESQCMAYSNDRGRTFKKYEANPILPSKKRFNTRDERDPKVFWYPKGKHWVLVLFEGTGLSIYNSDNLKEWTYKSHIKGFWECPELFELPVDGNRKNKKWIIYGGSGIYMIGDFDGETFVPETNKLTYHSGNLYAAQTYNNSPDGRRIQIGWGTIASPDMGFNQMMTFPGEFTLQTTGDSIRLFINPVKEIQTLYTEKNWKYENLNISVKNRDEVLKAVTGNQLHILAEISSQNSPLYGLNINGYELIYDTIANNLNGDFINTIDNKLKLEIIVDRNSIEVFINEGRFLKTIPYNSTDKDLGLKFITPDDPSSLINANIVVHELKSIWQL